MVVVAPHGDVDLVEQGVQQLLAVFVGGGRRGPHLVQVVAEGQDGGALVAGEGPGSCGLASGQLGFGVGEGSECLLPVGFQAAGDQPVLRVDGPVAAFGLGRVITRAFDLAAPLG